MPRFSTDYTGALDHRLHLPECDVARQVFQPAIRRNYQPRRGSHSGSARLIRFAMMSGVSTTMVERSNTPRIIVFPVSFERTEQSSEDCAVSIDICCARDSASSGRKE